MHQGRACVCAGVSLALGLCLHVHRDRVCACAGVSLVSGLFLHVHQVPAYSRAMLARALG